MPDSCFAISMNRLRESLATRNDVDCWDLPSSSFIMLESNRVSRCYLLRFGLMLRLWRKTLDLDCSNAFVEVENTSRCWFRQYYWRFGFQRLTLLVVKVTKSYPNEDLEKAPGNLQDLGNRWRSCSPPFCYCDGLSSSSFCSPVCDGQMQCPQYSTKLPGLEIVRLRSNRAAKFTMSATGIHSLNYYSLSDRHSKYSPWDLNQAAYICLALRESLAGSASYCCFGRLYSLLLSAVPFLLVLIFCYCCFGPARSDWLRWELLSPNLTSFPERRRRFLFASRRE